MCSYRSRVEGEHVDFSRLLLIPQNMVVAPLGELATPRMRHTSSVPHLELVTPQRVRPTRRPASEAILGAVR